MSHVVHSSPSGPLVGPLLRGLNLDVNREGRLSPMSDPNRFFDWDYFCSGSNVSTAIGRLGWSLLGTGVPAYTRVSSNLSSVAKANLSTSNTNGNVASLTLGDTTGKTMGSPVNTTLLQCAWRMGNTLATKRVFFGWSNNFGINPNSSNVNAFGLFYDSTVSPFFTIENSCPEF